MAPARDAPQEVPSVVRAWQDGWTRLWGWDRGGSAWANGAAAKHHLSLPPLPSSERGRTENSTAAAVQPLPKHSPNTLLFDLFWCLLLSVWCYSSSPSPKCTEIKPTSAQHRQSSCRACRVFGQGYQPAKTPMCQTELIPALHHTLVWFKASLTVGKVSHYKALPPHSAGTTLGWLAER